MKRERNRAGKLGLALWLVCAAPVVTLAERADSPGKGAKAEKAEKAEHPPGSAKGPAPAAPDTPSPALSSSSGSAASGTSGASADPAGEGKGKHAHPGGDEAWPEVERFMETHSKRKWAAYQKLNPDNKRALRGQLINRFGELTKVPNKDLYELEVQRVEIEDEMFGALSDLKRAKAPAEKERIRKDELRPVVEKLIHNRMQERQVRVANLKNQLSRLEKEVEQDGTLKADTGKFNAFISRRADQIERHELGGAAPEPHPNRRHPAGGAGSTTASATSRPSQPAEAQDDVADPAE